MSRGSREAGDERLTSRLDAFGDLVFGFSLSFIAIRLDVPSRPVDMAVNFAFLFGIAILPYAVQVFLRFQLQLLPFTLYLGDLIVVLTTLSFLRVRSLRQRRADHDADGRLRDWRRTVAQLIGALVAAFLLAVMHRPGANFQSDVRLFGSYAVPGLAVLILLVRRSIRHLPEFLR